LVAVYTANRSNRGGCQNEAAYKGRELSVLISVKLHWAGGGIVITGALTGMAAMEHPAQVEKGEQLSCFSFLSG